MRQIHAAGGVVWRLTDNGVEVVLVHRPRRRDWTLPKGKLDPGESILTAACREVREETGMRAAPQNYLSRVRYLVPTPDGFAEKIADYWVMRLVSTGFFAPHDEIDDIRWVPVEHAPELLDYPRDIALIADFAAQPRVTGVVVACHIPDRAHQTSALNRMISLFEPERIALFWPYQCQRILEPLAIQSGLILEKIPPLGGKIGGGEVDAGTAGLVRAYASAHAATVVCGESDTVRQLVAELAEVDGVTLPPTALGDITLRVLSFVGRMLVSVDSLLANGAPEQASRP